MMASNEEEDDDSDDEDEDIDDSPALAASQALDTLALNLPPEKYITNLMAQVLHFCKWIAKGKVGSLEKYFLS